VELPSDYPGFAAECHEVEDCALSAGRLVKRLPHARCASCGERFFDVTAITTIEATAHRSARKRLA
jgi:hypothetical protein